jgi:hypothetical protein
MGLAPEDKLGPGREDRYWYSRAGSQNLLLEYLSSTGT